MIWTAILALALPSNGTASASHPLDVFMRDVTEACLLPDLEKSDPRQYFASHGWSGGEHHGTFKKQIAEAQYIVSVKWPATRKASASCSFVSGDVTAYDAYDWFRKRIGEPESIAWSEHQVAGWKMTTNGHDAGVYVNRKLNQNGSLVGMVLHILQS